MHYYGGLGKKVDHLKRNQFKKLQMVQFECFTFHFQPLLLPFLGCVESGKLWNKMNLTGCKWSNLNAFHLFCFWRNPFSYFQPLLLPFFGWVKSGRILKQKECNRLQIIQSKCLHLIHFWRNPFSHFQPLLLPFLGWVKSGKLWNKMNLTSCKWSNFNALRSELPSC